jgi:hypothetical protein
MPVGIPPSPDPDSIAAHQTLYNGRIWKNPHLSVKGDPFLFTREYLSGSVTMHGKSFAGIKLKYDIFSDELLIPLGTEGLLKLNREMTDSFCFIFEQKKYTFVKIPEDSLNGLAGYAEVLYKGGSALYRKYTKKIDRPGVENSGDRFYQFDRTYLVLNGIPIPVKNRHELLRAFPAEKEKMREYMRKNRIRVTSDPSSFIPIVLFHDQLTQ